MATDYRRLLESMRAQILSQQPNRADPVREGNEMADEDVQPLTEMSQSIASARNAKNAVLLQQIEAALDKLDREPDEFGRCEECDEMIGERRLEKMPWALFCIRCQSAREGGGSSTRKSLTDYR
jgi:DnaK suppressor protein